MKRLFEPTFALTRGRRGGGGVSRVSRPAARRGSVLVLVVTVIVIMAMLGATYLQSVRVQRVAMANLGQESYLDEVAASAIQQIAATLKADITDDPDDADDFELYDYPWTNPDATFDAEAIFTGEITPIGNAQDDIWLASSAPDFIDPANPVWPKITNLRGYFVGGTDGHGDLDDETNGIENEPDETNEFVVGGADGNVDADNDGIADTPSVSDMGLELDLDLLVDADGDGIGDSRWTWAPLAQVDGKMYVMAVRIVDLSSMLNVNVSWFDTFATPISADMHWRNPSDLNFGYLSDGYARVTASDWSGWYDASGQFYAPDGLDEAADTTLMFGSTSEYEIRNRNGLNYAENEAPVEMATPGYRALFRQDMSDPDAGDNETVYTDVDGVSSTPGLAAMEEFYWGPGAETGGLAEPRKWLTTMSGASVFAMPTGATVDFDPSRGGAISESNAGTHLQVDVNRSLEAFFAAGLPAALDVVRQRVEDVYTDAEAATIPGGYTAAQFASAFVANLIDYADDDNAVAQQQLSAYTDPVSGEVYIGMEALPAITEIYRQREYEAEWQQTVEAPPSGVWDAMFVKQGDTGYAIEIRNPFPIEVRLDQVHMLFDGESPSSSNLLSAYFGQPTLGAGETAVLYHNPDSGTAEPIEDLWDSADVDVEVAGSRIAAFDPATPPVPSDPIEVSLAAKVNDLSGSLPTGPGDGPVVTYQRLRMVHMGLDEIELWQNASYDSANYNDVPGTGPDGASEPMTPVLPTGRFYVQRTHVGSTHGVEALLTTSAEFQSWTRATTVPNASYEDEDYDALGLLDKNLAGYSWRADPKIGGTLGTPQDQILVANHSDQVLDQVGELALVSVISPRYVDGGSSDRTIAEVWSDYSGGVDSVDAFRLDFVTDSGNVMSTADDTRQVSPASFLIDQFTLLHPGFADDQNDNSDVVTIDDELMVTGRINVNTAPYEVLRRVLPIPQSDSATWGLATPTSAGVDQLRDYFTWAITGYRDNPDDPAHRPGSRRTQPGIAYIGELFDTHPGSGSFLQVASNILGADTDDLYFISGHPAVQLDQISNITGNADDVVDDREEKLLLPRLMSNLLTTRSDTYVAYIYIQGYTAGDFSAGPVESGRFVVVFRRGIDEDGEPFVKAYLPGGQIYETK